ncbi:MAG: hypothetical protein UX08_C0007G0104 [Candidatus Collierbacteria bacterium GW2011_GWB1_45_35]|nr:MAG: hypothetical protein UW48_C0001G0005 [Microgenomates group bacterium GW2011_GWC1_44_23]KKT96125.1 MAG: hypothetical protein UW96_C0001G0003 [Candidatus Collierbacteria bacterium GW2011_GWA1_45_15]KKU01165.1 MAG: hypothetical protein UX01_C0001G0009 [Candidatus Collierbacteria bacterium GW2011_GWB2_45_17]KKU05407.1 MAG: hypothetical protein UX08_C0007G0104 [Candidatus Collierbacteria bacterium GW2011_GWB1_45_35]KKU06611.1 MAG: hypothetical protein UX11_C0032G0003 [Candidatus Collierbacte
MNTKQWIFSILVLVVAIWVGVEKTHSQTMYGTTVSFTVDASDKITITGADLVSVNSEDDGYYRIYAGESRLIGYPDEKDQFSAEDPVFPTQDWQIKDGIGVDVTIKSDHTVVITREHSVENKSFTIYLIAVLTLFILFIGSFFLGN